VILLVDSDQNSQSVLAYTLNIRGFRVVTASNAAEAIRVFCGDHCDLVLAQAWIPRGVTGFEMTRQMKAIAAHVPVVLLGAKENVNELHCADAFLTRSVKPDELIERIKVMSARKRGPRKGFHWDSVNGERRSVRNESVDARKAVMA